MEGLWDFSLPSEPFVECFLNTMRRNDKQLNPTLDQRWVKYFQSLDTMNLQISKENPFVVYTDDPHRHYMGHCTTKSDLGQIMNSFDVSDVANFNFLIEENVAAHFGDIVSECVKCPNLIPMFAANLKQSNLEKLLAYAFSKKNLPELFLYGLFTNIVTTTLRHGLSKSNLDLLISGYKAYPDKFLKVLVPLLFVGDQPEGTLLNFVKSLSRDDKTVVMHAVCKTQLGREHIAQHARSIYELYKDCKKGPTVQDYIHHCLKMTSDMCVNDVTYGRLLLTHLQCEDQFVMSLNYSTLLNLVSNHGSIFKKSCEKALRNLSGCCMDIATTPYYM